MIDVCCALIEEGDQEHRKLWIARKPESSHLAGLWEFPGGKIEPGESGREAIEREIFEELGVSICAGRALLPSIHDYGTHCIRLFPFICRMADAEKLPCPLEHQALALLRLERLPELPWAPADLPILLNYLAQQSAGIHPDRNCCTTSEFP